MAFDRKEYLRQWHLKNRERRLIAQNERTVRTRDERLAFYAANKERLNDERRSGYAANKDEINARRRRPGAAARKPRMRKTQIDEICRRYAAGEYSKAISRDFGIGISAVLYFVHKRGIAPHRSGHQILNDAEHDRLVSEYKAGKSVVQLALETGHGEGVVYEAIRRRGANRHSNDPMYICALRENAFENAERIPAAAYWIGFLMTDGCITGPKGPAQRYTLSLGLQEKDARHVHKFRDFMGSDAKIVIRKRSVSAGALIIKSQQACYIAMRCPPMMRQTLFHHGIVPRKTFIAKVSNELRYNPHFWRGAIDGDGTITQREQCRAPYPAVKFCSGSVSLANQFADFVLKYAWRRPTVQDVRRPGFQPQYRIDVGGVRAMTLIRLMYERSNVALNRKQERADYLMEIERLNPHWLRNKTSGAKPIILPLWPDPFKRK